MALVDIFNELFFGAGIWLAVIILLILILVGAQTNKYLRICFIPVSILVGIWYLNNIDLNSEFVWIPIIFFICSIFLTFMIVKDR